MTAYLLRDTTSFLFIYIYLYVKLTLNNSLHKIAENSLSELYVSVLNDIVIS